MLKLRQLVKYDKGDIFFYVYRQVGFMNFNQLGIVSPTDRYNAEISNIPYKDHECSLTVRLVYSNLLQDFLNGCLNLSLSFIHF